MVLNVFIDDRKDGTYLVKPEGRIDSETYLIFEEKLKTVILRRPRVLVVDMQDMNYISSAGLGVIFNIMKIVESTGGKFLMTNLKPQIKKVFEIVKALPEKSIFQSMDEVDAYLDAIQKKEIDKEGDEGDKDAFGDA